jgi:uncharacterized repeat protein (TIGR01451 family)
MRPPTAAEPGARENVIEMSIMRTASRRRGLARSRRLLGASIAAGLLLLALSSSAMADPVWSITSHHGSQHMTPGGEGQYVLQVFNDGDSPQTSTVTVTDTLPAGVVATAVSGQFWVCGGAGTGTVTCTRATSPGNRLIQPPSPISSVRGAAPPIFVTVTVDPSLEGTTIDNVATISGGGGADATAVDPTTFSSTPAGFGIVPGSFLADAFDATGAPLRQAGAHPFELRLNFDMNLRYVDDPLRGGRFTEPDERTRNVEVRLPRGTIGNPEATPKCNAAQLNSGSQFGDCPVASQVGTVEVVASNVNDIVPPNNLRALPVYNMVPPPDAVAAFAFMVLGQPVYIKATLDPTDYSIVTRVENTTSQLPVRSTHLRMWGVPADPAHDPLRLDPRPFFYGAASPGPIKPFLTIPYDCSVAGTTRIAVDSWPHAGTPVATDSAESPPAVSTGCNDPRLRFHPTIRLRPTSTQVDSPTGLSVDIDVPQKDDTILTPAELGSLYADSDRDVALNTPPVRTVSVVLPEGMTVSPSSADGLAACSPAQIGLGTNDEPTCPDASKIGTVTIDTPLLPDPLTGHVFLAQQSANPFGTLLALYIVARGPGVIVKLPGKIELDPVSGRLTTTFDDNPQLPFSNLHVQFKSGPRAPLSTPLTCGVVTATAEITSWDDRLPPAQASDSFAISADGAGAPCDPPGFHPRLDDAGTINPVAGKDSPLVTTISRPDGDEPIGGVDLSLPTGLLGRVANVDLCAEAAANAGACGDDSRIGTTTVAAGPGSTPFYVNGGRVYMTGPYKGAPFGLSIVVPAKAGPFDLGDVVVRAQVQVDRNTAALRVVTDPLPTILQGIPLQLRLVNVTVDRPGFTFNPTSCAAKQVTGTVSSDSGTTADVASRFQVAGCAGLPFRPRMTFTVGARGHTRVRQSTPLTATVRMTRGQANLRGVKVALPSTLSALLPVVNRQCSFEEFRSEHCAKARIGTAVAVTPLLRDPLRGSAYFVDDPHAPLPHLMVALHGQVDFDLTGKITIPGGKRLATNFDTVPDVPITKFTLSLVSGRNGPVGVARNLCSRRARASTVALEFRSQSGKVVRRDQRMRIEGCGRVRRAR